MLIDALRTVGLDRLAQAHLGVRQNRHQSLRDLGLMAYAILVTAERRLGRSPQAGPYLIPDADPPERPVPLDERPPLATIRVGRDGGDGGRWPASPRTATAPSWSAARSADRPGRWGDRRRARDRRALPLRQVAHSPVLRRHAQDHPLLGPERGRGPHVAQASAVAGGQRRAASGSRRAPTRRAVGRPVGLHERHEPRAPQRMWPASAGLAAREPARQVDGGDAPWTASASTCSSKNAVAPPSKPRRRSASA